jgi:hypothetical protein
MSVAARKKIAAAQRARWAKVKAAQKKSAWEQPMVRNGKILTDKAKRRLRRDRQPVHRLRSAAAQLD